MPKSGPERVSVLGVPVDCVDMQGALCVVEEAIENDDRLTVLAVNPEKVMAARRNVETMVSLRKAGLLIPDGIGIVWAVRLLTGLQVARVPGSELMPAICNLAARKGYRVFLYGAESDVVNSACGALLKKLPTLKIVGAQHGFVLEHEMSGLIQRIKASEADVLFVALGSPRQEHWIERHLDELNVKVYQGVGGTFDVLAGRVYRAPRLFREFHLEWFYRLIVDPKRLVRQSVLPLFVILVLWKKLLNRN